MLLKTGSETERHAALKSLAAGWAWEHGFRALAFEVRAPRSRFRVDVAGYRAARTSLDGRACVAIFECKQSRPDLLRDVGDRDHLLASLQACQERRIQLESLLKLHFPSLRTGDCLFPEWETFPAEQLNHRSWNQLTAKIASLQRQLRTCLKFGLLSGYQTANLHWVVAPAGLVDPAELPPAWGLLEATPTGVPVIAVSSQYVSSRNEVAWLERIAQRATKAWRQTLELTAAADQSVTAPNAADLTC